MCTWLYMQWKSVAVYSKHNALRMQRTSADNETALKAKLNTYPPDTVLRHTDINEPYE